MKIKTTDNPLNVTRLCFFLVAIVLFVGIPAQADQLTLEVTDFEGKILQLENAHVFVEVPTPCNSCSTKVETFDGIEVVDDSKKALIFWKDIEKVEKESADDEAVTIFLTDGKTKTVILSTDPEQYVSGDTEGGEYYNTLNLQDVKLIRVVREQETPATHP